MRTVPGGRAPHEQVGQGRRPSLGHGEAAAGEAAQGEVGDAAGGGEFRVAEQGGEQRPEHAGHGARRQAAGAQCCERGAFGPGEQAFLGQGGQPPEGGAEARLVEGAAGEGAGGGEGSGPELFAVGVDQDPGREGPQREVLEAGGAFELRVRGVEQLADPVQPEPVGRNGGHPAAGVARGLQDGDRDPRCDQVVRGRES